MVIYNFWLIDFYNYDIKNKINYKISSLLWTPPLISYSEDDILESLAKLEQSRQSKLSQEAINWSSQLIC